MDDAVALALYCALRTKASPASGIFAAKAARGSRTSLVVVKRLWRFAARATYNDFGYRCEETP